MRLLLLLVPLMALAVAGPAAAEKLAGNLTNDSPSFEDYRYSAYQFEVLESNGWVAMQSPDIDGYILLKGPQGKILSNDDASPELATTISKATADNSNDMLAGVEFSTNDQGIWTMVVTSYGESGTGSFEIHSDGLSTLTDVTSNVDRTALAEMFSARGVEDSVAKRLATIETAAQRLSLASHRDEIKQGVRRDTNLRASQRVSSQSLLVEKEKEESDLKEAVEATKSLGKSSELVRSILERELLRNRTEAESSAADAANHLSRIQLNDGVEKEMLELDALAKKVEVLEKSLLESSTPEAIANIRPQLALARQIFATRAKEIAERLLDSGVIDEIRFGSIFGGSILARRYNSDRVFLRAEELVGGGLDYFDGGALIIGRVSRGLASNASFADRHIQVEKARARPASNNAGDTAIPHLPQIFPWPPPAASARGRIDRRLFGTPEPNSLGEVADILAKGLADAGYTGPGYLGVPSGFAMVTRIEQTDRYGRPLRGEARWATSIAAIRSFSIEGILRALLTSEPGYFRVVLLVVTDERFAMAPSRGRLQTLETWAQQGLDGLVPSVRAHPFTADYGITALIYEFEKMSKGADPEVRLPGRHTLPDHIGHTMFAKFIL